MSLVSMDNKDDHVGKRENLTISLWMVQGPIQLMCLYPTPALQQDHMLQPKRRACYAYSIMDDPASHVILKKAWCSFDAIHNTVTASCINQVDTVYGAYSTTCDSLIYPFLVTKLVIALNGLWVVLMNHEIVILA